MIVLEMCSIRGLSSLWAIRLHGCMDDHLNMQQPFASAHWLGKGDIEKERRSCCSCACEDSKHALQSKLAMQAIQLHCEGS